MSTTAALAAELRGIQQFADLSEEALDWLASHMQLVELEAGQQFFAAGAPADRMMVILEGELRNQAETLLYTAERALAEYGQVLPPDERDLIERDLGELKRAVVEGNPEELRALIVRLEVSAQRIGELIYASVGDGETS